MTKREAALAQAKVAGYHRDTGWFTRLLVESRVNRDAMYDAWVQGTQAKNNGVRCVCSECKS